VRHRLLRGEIAAPAQVDATFFHLLILLRNSLTNFLSPGGAAVISQGCEPLVGVEQTKSGALEGRPAWPQPLSPIPEVPLVVFDVALPQEGDELCLEGGNPYGLMADCGRRRLSPLRG
jgi:hypothetical protein